MNIEPITITISGECFATLCSLFAAQLAIAIVCILDLIDKPKRNKRS